MGKLAAEVKAGRARRDAARAAFDTRLAQVKQDLSARSLAGRFAHKLEEEASDAMAEAVEIASESKGVAVGTAAALALWFFRNPVMAWVEGMFAASHDEDGENGESGPVADPLENGEPSEVPVGDS